MKRSAPATDEAAASKKPSNDAEADSLKFTFGSFDFEHERGPVEVFVKNYEFPISTARNNYPEHAWLLETMPVNMYRGSTMVYYSGYVVDGKPHGEGIMYQSDRERCLQGTFVDGKAHGVCREIVKEGFYEVGEYKDGLRQGLFYGYDKTGFQTAEAIFKDDKFHGPCTKFFKSGATWKGTLVNGKREDNWLFTEADGSFYSVVYKNGIELDRSDTTRPLDVDPNGLTDAAMSNSEVASAAAIVLKVRDQKESRFLNKTVEEWRKEYPSIKFTTHYPIGSKEADLLVEHDSTRFLGEFKANSRDVPCAEGQVRKYRWLLRRLNGHIDAEMEGGKIVTFVALPTPPDVDDVAFAMEESGTRVWWPGQPIPFLLPNANGNNGA